MSHNEMPETDRRDPTFWRQDEESPLELANRLLATREGVEQALVLLEEHSIEELAERFGGRDAADHFVADWLGGGYWRADRGFAARLRNGIESALRSALELGTRPWLTVLQSPGAELPGIASTSSTIQTTIVISIPPSPRAAATITPAPLRATAESLPQA